MRHVVGHTMIKIDKAKVQAIEFWKTPKRATKLRSFLGFVNYYRKFICGHSFIASLLTNLLKKNKP